MYQSTGNIKPRKLLWSRPLMVIALLGMFLGASTLQAHAAASKRLTYYGADLNLMERATGISTTTGMPTQAGPWPQYTSNYCFDAVIQAITNYRDLIRGLPMEYPNQSDQGPASGNPDDEQVGQILYDLDHAMIPPDGPLAIQGSGVNRRPFTLANIAYDFGGDPRSQAFGINYEAPAGLKYHEHIYHTSAQEATLGMVRSLVRYREPVDVLVNHAEHSVLVAGFWATGNPLIDPNAEISAFAVFNPWDMNWGAYLSTTNYEKVSYDDWINATALPTPWGGVTTWLNLPYDSNGILDPDPSIGIYQAGAGTKNPNAHHWIGNYVIIQPDTHPQSANFSFDEHDHLMLKP